MGNYNANSYDEEIFNNIKIGARALSSNQLRELLPNYEDIKIRKEKIRRIAQEYGKFAKDEFKRELQRNSNNVFSILGGRGSGKTSVLLTIKNEIIKENKNNDFMLPLIIPENMGEGSDILGWTICAFENLIDDIKSNNICCNNGYCIRDNFENCRKVDDDSLRRSFNELIKYYTYVKQEYKNILVNNYDGFNEFRDKNKEAISAERVLLNKFEEFIDNLLYIRREQINKEPLIYVFFDDIDLTSGRCLEIVNMILKYLAHPNIIVFVAGDYSTFAEALTINLLNKDNLLNNLDGYFDASTKQTALEKRKLLARDVLKKAMPPAYRFYMPILDNKAKSNFKYSIFNEKEDKYYTILELIKVKLLAKSKDDKKNFLYYKNNLIDIYFKIFDDNPRGLINMYQFLNSIDINNSNYSYSIILKDFLKLIMDTNSELDEIKTEILSVINIQDKLDETYINYELIREMYRNDCKIDINNKKVVVEKYIKLFLLAYLIENLIVEKKINPRRRTHGLDVWVEIINSMNTVNLIPNYYEDDFVLSLYSEIDKNIRMSKKYEFDGYKLNYFTIKYIEILYRLLGFENVRSKKGDRGGMLSNIVVQDMQWVKGIIEVVFQSTCSQWQLMLKRVNEIDNIIIVKDAGEINLKEIVIKEMHDYYKRDITEIIHNNMFKYRENYSLESEEDFKYILQGNEEELKLIKSFFSNRKLIISREFKEIIEEIYLETTHMEINNRLPVSAARRMEKIYELIVRNDFISEIQVKRVRRDLLSMEIYLERRSVNNLIEKACEIAGKLSYSLSINDIEEIEELILVNDEEQDKEFSGEEKIINVIVRKTIDNVLIKTYIDYLQVRQSKEHMEKDNIYFKINQLKRYILEENNTFIRLLRKQVEKKISTIDIG